ncbi:hypothetical protein EW026_g686 [Hermanssonia centrifuga]|uniref:Uncharacterized protein n=1 Tax=Hermanssonia centrifuga TaxID=98765 RepID=A0A4S4KVQ6_9APHY|nr:hypothetical protein EW026_g686 [Hermanssonia centrifuga]
MSSFFSALKDKAQSAVNATPLAGHIPGSSPRPETPESSTATGQSPGGGPLAGITKSHTFETLHHQLRTFQQQYSSSTTPVQKIITSGKGVAIDYDNVARDAQGNSKELYLWGQSEQDDLKDVTDRLGWVNYIQGQLSATLATKINTARAPFKALRDAENALAPRRNARNGLQNQIARIEHDQRKDQQPKLAELRAQLQRAEEEDDEAEREVEILKRKAVKESEQLKWEAVREYAEKLTMVAQAGIAIVPALPSTPPSPTRPYNGASTTASARASLQKALDNYSPGNVTLIVGSPSAADLKHTKSFGETHAKELSRIGLSDPSATGNIPITPPLTTATAPPPGPPSQSYLSQSPSFSHPISSPLSASGPTPIATAPGHSTSATASSPTKISPPLNPANLNQAPSPIPISNHAASAMVAPNPTDPSIKIPSVTPTVAETGVPKSAGPDGPGPSSGSLLNNRPHSPTIPRQQPPALPPRFENAEGEKRRLEREERERVLRGDHDSSLHPQYESAEEEKKRLEREERERILREGGTAGHQPPREDDHDGELPPYQEF